MENGGRIFILTDLSLLRIDEVSPFDLYLNSADKYVLYSKKGSCFTEELRLELILNGVKTVYVPDSDYDAYQEYIEKNLSAIIKDAGIGPQDKSKIVYGLIMICFRSLFLFFPVNRQIFYAKRFKFSIRCLIRVMLISIDETPFFSERNFNALTAGGEGSVSLKFIA